MPDPSQNNSDSDLNDLNRTTNEEQSFVRKLPDGNLLSQILGFSERELDDDEHIRQVERTLLPVAARHQNEKQLSEKIAQELVSALIPDIPGLTPPLSEELLEWVARTLFSDPLAHGRLERMWVQLTERCADGRK